MMPPEKYVPTGYYSGWVNYGEENKVHKVPDLITTSFHIHTCSAKREQNR